LLRQFPQSITGGVSLRVEFTCSDYPAPDWSLSAILRGPAQIQLDASDQVPGFLFSQTAVETAAMGAGLYAVSVRASMGDDVFEVEAGQLTILADLATFDAGHDSRGHAERTLAAIEAVLEGRAGRDQESYSINGRTLQRTPIADLLALKRHYVAEVAKLKAGGRARPIVGRKVRMRF
jgi:hypothetical protein